MSEDQSSYRVSPRSSSSRVPTTFLIAILFTVWVTPASAQVAANQLCGAAGYGPGCIGAFRPHGMVRPGGGAPSPNVGGLLGGILTSIVTGIVMDAVMSELTKPGPQAETAITPNRVEAFQKSVGQQQRFQDEREHKLLESMIDASTLRLADSTAKMDLLEGDDESIWFKAGCSFDRGDCGDPGTLWMATHDAWFSTEMIGGVAQSSGARPLPLGEQRVQYSPENFQPIRCTGPVGPYGGQLCSFPQVKRPVIKLEQIKISRPPAPPAPPQTDPGVARLESGTGVPKLLGRGAPDIPPVLRFDDRKVVPDYSTDPCAQAPMIEGEGFFVGAARRRLFAIEQARKDPRTYVDILTTAVIEKANLLPGVQGTIASMNLKAYSSFMRKLVCDTFALLTDAVTNPDAALQKSDEILKWAGHGLVDSFEGGRIMRLSLTNRVEEAIGELKEKIIDDLLDAVKDLLKNRALGTLEKKLEDALQAYERSRDPHRLNELIEKAKDLTLTTVNPSDPAFQRYRLPRLIERLEKELWGPGQRTPEWVKDLNRETASAVDKWVVGDEWGRGVKLGTDKIARTAGDIRTRIHHWLVKHAP